MGLPDAGAPIRIGSRGSDLALKQAAEVSDHLRIHGPGIVVEHVVIQTHGDRVLDVPLARVGGKGLFTKELDDALLAGTIDLAVHSLKDVPTACPAGLTVTVVLAREDPRDVLVTASGATLETLPPGARIGTSSLRRRAQLLERRPDIRVLDARGNVTTRLAKLDRGEFDALVLARAGLVRLGLTDRIAQVIAPDVIVPAVGQGALAAQSRAADARVSRLLCLLDHRPTRLATLAERALLARLGGGCQVPIGAFGTWRDGVLALTAIVADIDGRGSVRGRERASVDCESDAADAGTRLADRLLGDGARALLDRARAALGTTGGDQP
ncbi:MAG: hydroxymethylbilane synthase [Acidobacteria bacterium]|nr:hydroxymethylbilane synthase [Acidobacteriota bacterium]